MAMLCGVGIAVPVDKELPTNEIENVINRSRATAVIYSTKKKDVIKNYKPMFTEWSLSKLIREGKIKYIRVGRKIFLTKQAVDEYIKNQEENSLRESFHIL